MKISMRFMAGNVVDDVLFFSAMQYNGLFRINLSNGEISFVNSFIEVPLDKTVLHRLCLVYDRWLVFIPQNFNKIHLVNTDTLEQKTITVTDGSSNLMIADAFIMENLLYILPAKKTQPALIIHMEDLKVEPIKAFNEWFGNEAPNSPNKNGVIVAKTALFNDSIYMGLYDQNRVLKYDLKSETIRLIDTDIEKIYRVYGGSDGIWITDHSSGKTELFNNSFEKYEKENNCTYGIILEQGEYVYAIPGDAPRIKIIKGNGAPREIEYPEEFKNLEQTRSKTYKFFGYTTYNEEIYLFPYIHDHMLVIHEDKLRVIRMEYEFDRTDPSSEQFMKILNARGKYLQSNGPVLENSTYDIDAYVELVKSL